MILILIVAEKYHETVETRVKCNNTGDEKRTAQLLNQNYTTAWKTTQVSHGTVEFSNSKLDS